MIKHYANIVIGGGPGGINMAMELGKRGIEYILLEGADNVGGQWGKFPVCGELISLNKKYVPGDDHYYKMRYDWHSLSTITAEDAAADPKLLFTNWTSKHWPSARLYRTYLQYVADNMGVAENTMYNTRVENIARKDGMFVLSTSQGLTYTADRILCGTGTSEAVMPDIRGLNDETCIMYADYDPETAPERFKDKTVIVLGRGNSAFEIAHNLIDITAETRVVSRSLPSFARQSHNVHDVRAQIADVYDLMQLKSNNSVICDRIVEVERVKSGPQEGRLLVHWETACPHWSPPRWVKRTSYVDDIIVACGFNFTLANIFDQKTVKPLVDNKGKFCLLSDTWESLNVPNLYFIGAPMRVNDPDAASGFVHGFRCNIQALGHVIAEKHNIAVEPEFECDIAVANPSEGMAELSKQLVKMVSTTMPLFELFTYFGSMVTFDETDDAGTLKARLWPAFPRDHNKRRFGEVKNRIEVVFEYGFHKYGDGQLPSHYFSLPADHFDTAKSAYVHPVFHIYRDGREVEEMHMQESLICRWDQDDYVDEQTNVDQYKNVAFNAAARAIGSDERRSILPVYEEFIEECYPEMTQDEIDDALAMLPTTRFLMDHVTDAKKAKASAPSRKKEELPA